MTTFEIQIKNVDEAIKAMYGSSRAYCGGIPEGLATEQVEDYLLDNDLVYCRCIMGGWELWLTEKGMAKAEGRLSPRGW